VKKPLNNIPFCLIFLFLLPPAIAQDYEKRVAESFHSPLISTTLSDFDTYQDELLTDWRILARTIAPSGQEEPRARYLVKRMREIGVPAVSIDRSGNAVGIIKGTGSGPIAAFLGTMDDLATVAEMVKQRNALPAVRDGLLLGPGTNSSASSVNLLGLARLFTAPGIRLRGTIYLVGVVQEETGLTGIKGFLDDHPDEIDYVIDATAGIGRISYGALGIHWFKIHFKGPRGHTLRQRFPNVTRGIAKAVSRISDLPVPETEDTQTFLNIAMLHAGQVYNHKPDDGWFSVDLRSIDNPTLFETKKKILSIAEEVAVEEGLEWEIEKYSESPAGQIPGHRGSPLVQTAEEATKILGFSPSLSNRGSSNMNVGINRNIPSISVGGQRGGKRDLPDEFANIEPVFMGMKLNFLIGFILTK